MFIDKFKSAKSIDLDKSLKAYVMKHYDAEAYDQIQPFISEFLQNRNVVTGLSELDKSLEKLKSYKDTLVTYLNMLAILKSKITFGKEEFCVKIEFSWKDVLKEDFWTSYNINYEYYASLFNLGVIYNLLGRFFISSQDDGKLKEGIKYFQNAAWVFDKVKAEMPSYIPIKETSPDLSANYLSYVKNKF